MFIFNCEGVSEREGRREGKTEREEGDGWGGVDKKAEVVDSRPGNQWAGLAMKEASWMCSIHHDKHAHIHTYNIGTLSFPLVGLTTRTLDMTRMDS